MKSNRSSMYQLLLATVLACLLPTSAVAADDNHDIVANVGLIEEKLIQCLEIKNTIESVHLEIKLHHNRLQKLIDQAFLSLKS